MRMRVIAADDEGAIRRLLLRWFQTRGWTIDVFDSGEALVEASRRLEPDLVISDINMPGKLNGLEACQAIRRERPKTRIVVMTGDRGNLPAIREKGFKRILAKPFHLADLETILADKPGKQS